MAHRILHRTTLTAALLAWTAACGGGSQAASPAPGTPPASDGDGPSIVQPGAPGEDTRAFDAARLDEVQGTEYTEADVAFMQGMIHHHAQALQMTALIPERAGSAAVRQMGLRMEISQKDEIGLMARWLEERDKEVPDWEAMLRTSQMAGGMAGDMIDAHEGHDMGGDGSMAMMPGMLSPAQLQDLRDADGTPFDRLFLEYMIQHHIGALTMVRDLLNTSGAAQESRVFQFAHEVDADQTIEIRRMRQVLETLDGAR